MRTSSNQNRRAEKYKRIGSEKPTVGMASSWKRVTFMNGIYKAKRLTIGLRLKYRLMKKGNIIKIPMSNDIFRVKSPSSMPQQINHEIGGK